MTDPFPAWFDALEKRHTVNLTFQEVRRAVQALSATYVERRGRIETGAVFDGAGKRAGFAMFYAPLHFLLVREIVRALGAKETAVDSIMDLGCGTGAAGAAWALECDPFPRLIGIDRNAWAIEECKWTYRSLGLSGSVRPGDLRTLKVPRSTAIVAAFTVNELDPDTRAETLRTLLRVGQNGSPVLVIEPIARRLTAWWDDWLNAFSSAGGREDRWRFRIELPERLQLMDRAAGLDHSEVTGRSLWLPGRRARVGDHVLPKVRKVE